MSINGRKAIKIGLSVLIAISIWLYVGYVDPTDATLKVKDVPVEYVGETVLATRGLMLVSSSSDTVDLKLKAKKNLYWNFDTSEMSVQVDLGEITEPGVYTLNYTVGYPNNIQKSKVIVDDASVYSITVTIGELYKKTIDLKYKFTGSLDDGYVMQDPKISVTTLNIHGQQEDVMRVSYALVEFDLTGLTSTANEMVSYKYYDSGNNPLEGITIYANEDKVPLTVPIYLQKEVRLTADVAAAAGLRKEDVAVVLSPQKLLIAGEYYVVSELEQINVGSIDLADVISNSLSRTIKLKLPEGVVSVDGISEVTVNVTLKGACVRDIAVTDFKVENVAEGLEAAVTDESVPVTLRGKSSLLDDPSLAQKLSLTVDLSEVTAPGDYTVPAVVHYSGDSDLGILGSYTVQVHVSSSGENGTGE